MVYQLRHNKALTREDLRHLEKILWHDLGSKTDYESTFGEEPLLKLVTRIVGLEPLAANEAFSEFLTDEAMTIQQMEFVKLVVNHVISNGTVDKNLLNEYPFDKFGSVVSLFEGRVDVAN